jgi:hypothetical protein
MEEVVQEEVVQEERVELVEEEEPDASDASDEWGDMEEVVEFLWGKKQFTCRWSICGTQVHEAKVVLKDWREEALKVLWRDHSDNLEAREWINKQMKRRKGFNGIEQLAWERKWQGSWEIPAVAAHAQHVEMPIEEPAFDAVHDSNPQPVSGPMDLCGGYHDWHECTWPGYTGLEKRSCFDCNKMFRHKKDGLEGGKDVGIWPSEKNPGYYCKKVGCVAMCANMQKKK